jgi:hypothetical protein
MNMFMTAQEYNKHCLFQAHSLLVSNMDEEKEASLLTPVNKINHVSQFVRFPTEMFGLLLYYPQIQTVIHCTDSNQQLFCNKTSITVIIASSSSQPPPQ